MPYFPATDNEDQIATVSFSAGLLLRKPIRNFLEQRAFVDKDITYLETKGWFESDFKVRGPYHKIKAIYSYIERWAED